MGTGYPPHNKQGSRDEVRGDVHADSVPPLREENAPLQGNELPIPGDGSSDDVLSLLEENARLRRLVVKLSDLILKNVADRR